MKIRIIQWNISTRSDPNKICNYLSELKNSNDYVLISLQEVTRKAYNEILEQLNPDESIFSLDLRHPGKNEGANRKMGVAILSYRAKNLSADILARSVFPERTLIGNFMLNGKTLRILAFHSLTGVGYKKAKSSNFASIADFLELNNEKIDFVCFDANEPKVDSVNADNLVFWDNSDKGTNACLIMGNRKVHSLSDSYVTFLKNKNTIIFKEPLAISHKTKGVSRRYDYIFSSKKWKVVSVKYPYRASIDASSDHSAVVGDFMLVK